MNGDVSSVGGRSKPCWKLAEQYEMPVWFQLEGRCSGVSDRTLTANPEACEMECLSRPGAKDGTRHCRGSGSIGASKTASRFHLLVSVSPIFQADVTNRLQNAILAPLREALKRWQSGPVDRNLLVRGYHLWATRSKCRITATTRCTWSTAHHAPRTRLRAGNLTDAEWFRPTCSLYNRVTTAEKVAKNPLKARPFGNTPNEQNTDTVLYDLL